MRTLFAVLMGALLLAPAAAQATTGQGPDALVRELYDQWIAMAKARRELITTDKKALYTLTEAATTPYIDFTRLSRLVLGKYWRQASEAQRRRFLKEFREHLVRTYATAMVRYIDAKFVFKPTSYKPDDKYVVVRTETIPKGGRAAFSLNYVVYRDNDTWKAMDVTIEGVSVVATLRNVIRSEVQTKSLDRVIEEIAEKNRQAYR